MFNLMKTSVLFAILTSSTYASLIPQRVICTGQLSREYYSGENIVRNIHIDFTTQKITIADAAMNVKRQIEMSDNEINFKVSSDNSNFINSSSENWTMTFPHTRNSSLNYAVPESGGLFYLNGKLLKGITEDTKVAS
jgi:hypothetical protein